MTELQNSAFKEKASRVEDVSKILPEVGAVVLNNLDGRLYAADKFGWHRFGDPYSPVNFFIDFGGITQFNFKFKAPTTSTLTIIDGDGTVTDVAGQDATEVTHTTNYAAAGVYYFTVAGDVLDMTWIAVQNQAFVSGSMSGLANVPNLERINTKSTKITGDVDPLSTLTQMLQFNVNTSPATGDMGKLKTMTAITHLYINNTLLHGDIAELATFVDCQYFYAYDNLMDGDAAKLSALTSIIWIFLQNTKIAFKTVSLWSIASGGEINVSDCNMTPSQVDNALECFVNLTGCTINIGGNNAHRTSASDAAVHTLEQAGNTLTVNERLGENILANPTFQNWVDGTPEGWGKTVAEPNGQISEDALGCRFISTDGVANAAIWQQATASGKYYRALLEYTDEQAGELHLQNHIPFPGGEGSKSMLFKAPGGYPTLQRQDGAPADIAINNFTLHEIL